MQRINLESTQRHEQAVQLAGALDGLYSGTPEVSDWVGGRREGLSRLKKFNARVSAYAERRNVITSGSVSLLSPYIRHGMVTLPEIRDALVRRHERPEIAKFINELSVRVYWRRIYAEQGRAIHNDLEPAKVRLRHSLELPKGVPEGNTGLACIDIGLRQLYSRGYVHNHWRMYFAAYLIHFMGVDWRIGARLFMTHLLDGDPASNSLSWQWVASTFSHKPYIFNRENVEKYTDGAWCKQCLSRHSCPFDATYPELQRQLFGEEID